MEGPKRSASLALPSHKWEPPHESRETQALVVLGLGLGTMLEWYDFQLYAGLSNILSPHFFPQADPVAQAVAYWAVFAVAFVTRPVGSIIFGHIADGFGRKLSLLISLLAMGLPTVLIGCLPSYHMIGIAAPILLALLRAVQGLAVGGEYGTAIVYIFELAPPGWEGRQSSFIVALCNFGVLLGNLVVMLFVGVCSPEQLALWGWRIPFLVVIITVALAYFLRMHMPNTTEMLARARLAAEEEAEAAAAEAGGGQAAANGHHHKTLEEEIKEMRHRVPLGQLLLRHPVPLLLQVLVTTYSAAAYYSYTAWLPSHVNKLGAPLLTSQVMLCTSLIALIGVVLLTGYACDKGLAVCWAGGVFSLVGAVLPFALCAATGAFVAGSAAALAPVWVLQILLMAWTAVPLTALPTVGVNIYPPQVRASGYNLGYSLAFGLVGGLSPMAVTAMSGSSEAAERFGIAFWILAWGLASAVAFALTLWLYPVCNRTAQMPLTAEQRRPAEGPRLSMMRSMSLSKGGAAAAAEAALGGAAGGGDKGLDQD